MRARQQLARRLRCIRQHQFEGMPIMPATQPRHSKLDRAILASLLAMAATNLLVLAQQIEPASAFAATQGAAQAA